MEERITLHSHYDGLDVSILVTEPDDEPLAVLQLTHGMKGYKERFLPFMNYMAQHGIACVANDLRGHGESVRRKEDRGYMYEGGYVALVEDMKQVTDWIHQTYPGQPVFLLGHSMGSLAARIYMKTHDDAVSGVILCGSPSDSPISPAALFLAGLLNRFNDGRIRTGMIQNITSWIYNRRFSSEGRNAWTCSDADVRDAYAGNPAGAFEFTANGMYALMSMMRETYSHDGWQMANPQLPVYFISGSDDPCMRNEASFHAAAQLLADVGYSDVTSAIYGGMRHEVLNEKGKESVWNDILEHIL